MFCLEIGKRIEASSLFQLIEDMLKRETKASSEGKSVIDNLLQSDQTTNVELAVTHLINQGMLKVFDGQFDQAINTFREVQTLKPANIVAANNLATCKIFLTGGVYKVGESIKTLEDLVKKDALSNINE